jgi:hypothetical protein
LEPAAETDAMDEMDKPAKMDHAVRPAQLDWRARTVSPVNLDAMETAAATEVRDGTGAQGAMVKTAHREGMVATEHPGRQEQPTS